MKSIRVALIGAGMMGRFHGRTLAGMVGARLALVVDADLAAAEGVAAQSEGAHATRDLEAACGAGIDAWVIVTPAQTHADLIVRGAEAATIDEPKVADARATRSGDLTVVTCTLTMGQKVGWTTLPADPAPFMAVFQGTGDAAKVIAMANTNKPK